MTKNASKDKVPSHATEAQSIFNRLKQLEANGINVINFAFGTPGFETPEVVRKAALYALNMGSITPVPYDGLLELKQEICDYIDRTRGFRPKLEQIIIGPETKNLLFGLLVTIMDYGDEIISTNPSIPTYNRLTTLLGGKVKIISRKKKDNFKLELNKLKQLPGKKTRAMILNTPHNPTGNVLTNTEVQKVSEFASENKLFLISDETFNQIIYNGSHVSPAMFDNAQEQTIIIENLSYTFSLVGWRLSCCVGPEKVIKKMKSIMLDTVPLAPDFIQCAGAEALRNYDEIVPLIKEKYRKCSESMISGLNELDGFKCEMPTGAIYAFPEISGTGKSSGELADYLLEKAGVAVLPGDIFGDLGKKHIRLSFATSIENINEGLTRFRELF